jgi:hypothetical protein
MNRRDVIKNVALMLGGAFSAPTLMAMNHWENPIKTHPNGATFSLTQTQRNIVAEIAELILPKTTAPNEVSPGAKDVGVPAFIEMMMKDCYLQPEQQINVVLRMIDNQRIYNREYFCREKFPTKNLHEKLNHAPLVDMFWERHK